MPDWSPLIDATVSGSLAVGAVLLLRPAVRRWLGAAAAHWLWLLVLVRFLVPALPDAPFAWMPTGHESSLVDSTVSTSVRVEIADKDRDDQRRTSILSASGEMPARPWPWLALIWGGGVALLLFQAGLRSVIAARLRRQARDISGHPRLQQAWPPSVPPRCRLPVRVTDQLRTPALCGCWHPVILLPSSWLEELEPDDLRWVLLHELGHQRRGDLLWRWAFLIARSVHWFNPFVWLASHFAQLDAEMACDEWSLNRAGNPDPLRYGRILLKAAQMASAHRAVLPGHVAMAESNTGFARRFRFLDRARRRGPAVIPVTLVFVALLAWFVGPSPTSALDPLPAPPENTSNIPVTEIAAAPAHTALPGPEVVIESYFIEVTNGALDEFLSPALTENSASQKLSILSQERVQKLLAAGSQKKDIDLLTAPRITTRSGQRAVIEIIREFRYPTEFTNEKAGEITPAKFETRNTGVTLGITPTATKDGWIDLDVQPSVVEFFGFINYMGGRSQPESGEDALSGFLSTNPKTEQVVNQPVFNTRRFTTSVSVRPGQTVLLGGLGGTDYQTVKSERSFVDRVTLPIRGGTGSTKTIKIERRLFVFITARIFTGDPQSVATPSPSPASTVAAEPPATGQDGLPYGKPVAGKPGFAISPHAPDSGYVDLRGFPSNTEVRCPYTGKMFLVP